MSSENTFPVEGGCDCGGIRYRLMSRPLFVHCCHCTWCQRESGAAFALNAMIEAERVEPLLGAVEYVDTPSESGAGQRIARCPRCRIAVWSHYAGAGPVVAFVRVGTLDAPHVCPPDIHIFTRSKQPWVVIPPGMPAVEIYYDRAQYWPAESLERGKALLPKIDAYRRAREQAVEAGSTGVQVRVYDDPPQAVLSAIDVGLDAYNFSVAPLHEVRALAVTASADGTAIAGGAVGRTWGGCCELQQLWVDEPHRRQGIASRLLEAFERAAAERGCTTYYLTTLSYQAPEFYRKRGYRTLAEIAGYPRDIAKYLMEKKLP